MVLRENPIKTTQMDDLGVTPIYIIYGHPYIYIYYIYIGSPSTIHQVALDPCGFEVQLLRARPSPCGIQQRLSLQGHAGAAGSAAQLKPHRHTHTY